jgi:hypothetical protein
LISATGAITGAALTGTSLTVSTGNITGGNLILSGAITDSGVLNLQTTSSNANIVLTPNGTGQVTTPSAISATGNITGSFILGNGSQLTGISTGSSSSISNGTSNVSITTSGGNVTVAVGGTSNVMTVSTTGAAIIGTLSATGNVSFNQTIISISANTTAVSYASYVILASLVLTLPATPAVGNWVNFTNRSNTTTCVIGRNSSNIMGLAENMTLNSLNARATLAYTGAAQGWVMMNE